MTKRSQQIIRIGWIGIGVNVLLAVFKAIVGAIAGSISVVLDAVNNLSDVMSSVVTIIGARLAERPADLKHPFGHGRIEYFSAIIIAVFVLAAGVMSLIESVQKLAHPTVPHYTAVTLVVIVTGIVVKLFLGSYVKRLGRQLESDALIATGADALFDAVIALSTLVSAVVMLWWNVSLDGLLGVAISLLIIKSGLEMLSSPINQLLGSRVSPELVAQLREEVMEFDGVQGVYDVILHSYGPNLMIGSLHVSVSETMTAVDIHRLTRRISEAILERHNIVLTIGIYAVASSGGKLAEVQSAVMKVMKGHKDVLQAHGVCYFENEHRISVDVVPDVTVKDEKTFAQQLTDEISACFPDEQVTIVIDHNYMA